jgi:gamma-glutamylaminecyclotransferase
MRPRQRSIDERGHLCDRRTVPERLFVYGSLKRGLVHHAELAGAQFVAQAATARAYELVQVDRYPALVASESVPDGTECVRGELYLVDAALLEHLDAFEGEPYRRTEIRLADGTHAWCYVVSAPEAGTSPRVRGRCRVQPL